MDKYGTVPSKLFLNAFFTTSAKMNSYSVSYSASFFLTIMLCCATFASADHDSVWFEKVFDTGSYNMGIMQDRDGFLWFTTSGGLIRFDGYEQLVFAEGPDGLTSNFVPSIFEDSDGWLWIVTLSGLDRYNKNDGSINHFQPNPDVAGNIGSNCFNWAPNLIAEDLDSGIWIASRQGVFRYDKTAETFTAFLNDPGDDNSISSDDIWTIMTDNEGKVWIGTSVGLDVYDKSNGSFSHYRHDPQNSKSIGKGIVYAIYQDQKGVIWIGTSEGGLSRLKRDDNSFLSYTHNPQNPQSIANNEVFSITEDSSGNLWLGRTYSNGIGLERFDKKNQTFSLYTHDPQIPGSLSGNIVLTSFEDRSGILWIPENTGQVNKLDPYSHRFNLHKSDPKTPGTADLSGLTSIYEDSRKDIWIGGQNGLSRLDRQDGQWQAYNAEPGNQKAFWNNYAFSVIEDSQSDFWIATDDGYLSLFDRDKGIVLERYLNPYVQRTARQIIEDSSNPGLFWFGVEGYGLFNFDKKTKRYNRYKSEIFDSHGLANNYISTLLQDKNNIIWIQTHGGLHRLDPKNGKFSSYKHDPDDPSSISSNMVNDLFIDSRGIFWVSTDQGLNKFEPKTGKFTNYGKKNGFATLTIRAIEEDYAGDLWLGSNDGLLVFDPEREKVIRRYTRADGLQDNSFSLYGCSALKDSDGELWFVGLNGANSFYPEKIHHNTTPPNVYLLNLSQGGKKLVPQLKANKLTELYLSWRHNYFEFEYVALNFSQSQKNQYKYKLEGWDNGWFFAGNKRFGRYSGLSGGDYVLNIMAANNDGVWNNKPYVLNIHVETPFWQTFWFYGVLILLSSSLFSVYYLIRINQLKRFNKELEKANIDVTIAEKKYRSIFENAIEGIFQITSEGKLLSANPAAASIVGFTDPEEMQREFKYVRNWLQVSKKEWQHLVAILKRRSSVSDFDIQIRKKNDEIIWLTVNLRVIKDDKGKTLYFDGIMEDITVRKSADKQLRRYQEHLEQLVFERTKEYQQITVNLQQEILEREKVEEELLRSKKLESIGVLAGGIAHDFNNLMTVIMGNINLVQMQPGLQESSELKSAVQALNRAKNLTQKFITFSSGGDPMKQILNIETVVRSALELTLSGSNVQSFVSVDPDLWQVNIDADYVSQAMHNIIENSKQAMELGGTLNVVLKNLDRYCEYLQNETPVQCGNYVLIEFQDNGVGISPEHLPRIFDPYFTTADMGAEKGKGLGLTIAYSIIKKHGGYTFVKSARGEGTVVRLLLPACGSDENTDSLGNSKSYSHSSSRKKILLMDDEEMLRDIAKLMLHSLGHEVTLAADGITAISEYKQSVSSGRTFDAVILDLTIPGGIGGQEVARILKQFDPDLRAIVSSGYADDPVVANYRQFGFIDALSKPYDIADIQAMLDRMM